MQMYMVGGAVRDEILGVPSKDIDFTVVLDTTDPFFQITTDPFKVMRRHLLDMGFEIFLETPEYLTIRARFPDGKYLTNDMPDGSTRLATRPGLTADFVLARKESDYTDGRRPDVVEPGTLKDDLKRRDFTMNAIAKDSFGNYIDPFGGINDIERKIIRAVGNPHDRLEEDALRAIRALRFSVTKGFRIEHTLAYAMQSAPVRQAIRVQISDERIQQELSKMFRFNTLESLYALDNFPYLTEAMFAGKVSLDATLKTKGRG